MRGIAKHGSQKTKVGATSDPGVDIAGFRPCQQHSRKLQHIPAKQKCSGMSTSLVKARLKKPYALNPTPPDERRKAPHGQGFEGGGRKDLRGHSQTTRAR